jgi:hypothetical protein
MLNHFRSGSISDAEPVESRGRHENVIPGPCSSRVVGAWRLATLTRYQPAIGCNIQLSIEENRAKCSPNPVYAAKTGSVTGNADVAGRNSRRESPSKRALGWKRQLRFLTRTVSK